MKKILKIFVIFGIVIILSGCGTKKFTDYYDNMKVNKDNINGYSLNLRVYSTTKANIVNRNIIISNYMNRSYKIIVKDINANLYSILKNKTSNNNILNINKEDIKYIINGKSYEKNDNKEYTLSKEKITRYINPDAYLEGLKYIKKENSNKSIEIANNKYKLYKVIIKKEALDKIIKDTELKIIDKKDVNADIYINNNNYVYKIIYKLDNINIEATYYNIDKQKDIKIPNN